MAACAIPEVAMAVEQQERVERVEVRVSGGAGMIAAAPAADRAPGRELLGGLARARAHALRAEARRRGLRLGCVAVAAHGVVDPAPGRPLRGLALDVKIVTCEHVHQVRELARAVETHAAAAGAALPATLEIVALAAGAPPPRRRWRAAGVR